MGWFRPKEHDEEQLSAYLDGELSTRQTENVERHLSTCDACAALLEELRDTRTLLSALPAQSPSRSFVLGAEYARAPVREEARPSGRFNLALAPAVALSVFVALLVVDLGNFTSTSTNESADQFTAATSREAENDAAAPGTAGSVGASQPAPAADSSAAGASTDGGEAASSALEQATGAAEGGSEAPGATGDGPPAIMSAEEPTPAESDSALRSTGQAADEEALPEPITLEAPEPSEDDGISTLRVLQLLAGAAFLASGFYVFVWPRLSRGGS